MHLSMAAARWRATALVAAIVGAAASAYLLVEYVTGQPGVCLTGSGCDLVRASAFAYPLGIPTPLIGLVFYVAAAWMVLRTLGAPPIAGIAPGRALLALAMVGATAGMILTALEVFVIKAFCTWCLLQAGASLVLLAASISLALVESRASPEAHSNRVRQQAARALEGERTALRRSATLGGGVAALAVGALLAIGASGGGPTASPGASSLAPAGSPRLGSGAVEVVEFADFQCPGCAAVAPILADLARSNGMTLVYRYLPLDSIHQHADSSARAAAAADRQGSFWKMDAALYARQDAWKDLSAIEADAFFLALAGELRLDAAKWQADYVSPEVTAVVNEDRLAAQGMGLNSTPTLFIGGRHYTGLFGADAIRAAIAAATSSP
jgi:protein-disulfide isomerase